MKDEKLKIELQTAMGGSLINELIDRIEKKIACLNVQNQTGECRKIQRLKSYVYSSVGPLTFLNKQPNFIMT